MARASQHRRTAVATALLLAALGLAVAIGGAWLSHLHGSPYYLACGLAVLASGVLLPWRPRAALWLYGVFLAATIAWAVHEVRWDWWQLCCWLWPDTGRPQRKPSNKPNSKPRHNSSKSRRSRPTSR